jgi:hypothetical protein
MRDLSQVLEQKEMELERVRREIQALHLVIPLLAEDADWIDDWLTLPASQLSRAWTCKRERVAAKRAPAGQSFFLTSSPRGLTLRPSVHSAVFIDAVPASSTIPFRYSEDVEVQLLGLAIEIVPLPARRTAMPRAGHWQLFSNSPIIACKPRRAPGWYLARYRCAMPARLLDFLGTSASPAPLGELLHVFAGSGLSALLADAPRTHHSGEGMPRAICLLSHYISFIAKPRW